jgi:hypothetical protein
MDAWSTGPTKQLVHSYWAIANNETNKACMQKATCARQTTSVAIKRKYYYYYYY